MRCMSMGSFKPQSLPYRVIGSSYPLWEISHFLDFLPTMPDGIVCASDYIAHFIQRYLEEKG